MRSAHARLTSEELASGPSVVPLPHEQPKHLLDDSAILPLPTKSKKAIEAFRRSLEAVQESIGIKDVQSSRELLSLLGKAVRIDEPFVAKQLQWLEDSADRWMQRSPALAADAQNLLLSLRFFVTTDSRGVDPASTPPARGEEVPKLRDFGDTAKRTTVRKQSYVQPSRADLKALTVYLKPTTIRAIKNIASEIEKVGVLQLVAGLIEAEVERYQDPKFLAEALQRADDRRRKQLSATLSK